MAAQEYIDQSEEFWQEYVRGRKHVPDSFFNRIYDFHAQNGASFDLAHEPGAGAGIHSERLAKKFKKVIVSDISGSQVALAQSRLGHLPQFEFRTAPLESTDGLQKDSVDLFIAATCIHWSDVPKTIEAVAYQLKPGGTFAAWISGFLTLDDPKMQDVWERIWNKNQREKLEQDPELKDQKGRQVGFGALDSVDLPDDIFQPGAIRLKISRNGFGSDGTWNDKFPLEYRAKLQPLPSGVKESDIILMEEDDDWKTTDLNLENIKSTAASFAIPKDEPRYAELWKELENLLGEGGTTSGRWSASLVMAKKRSEA